MLRMKPSLQIPALGFFYALGALITFAMTLGSPSDPENSFLFGYSLERIILGAGLLAFSLTFLFLTWKQARDPGLSLRLWEMLANPTRTGTAFLLLSTVLLLICWTLLFLPDYRLGSLAGYVQRLFPILVWLAVTGAVTTVFLILARKSLVSTSADQSTWSVLRIGLITFGLLALVGIIIAVSGLGYRYPSDYWYGAGVPVLGLQIIFSLLAGGLFLWFEPRVADKQRTKLDILLFVLVWVVAAWFWAREPLSPNYFMPDTANNPIFPYSDGATFDQGSQYALIGQGLFNSEYFERVLYSVFLTYLHMLFGQDFTLLATVQAALFAVFPALIYLLGKELHSRALGVSAGILLTLRGVNAIAVAKWIDTASPKMFLTDFPTALGLVIFLLLLVKWMKQPARTGLLIWAGALLGLTMLVRSHVLTLFPVVLVFIPLLMKLRWKQVVMLGVLLVLGMIAVTFPWELRNQSRGIPMYSMYYSRIVTILRYRYGIGVDAYLPSRQPEFAGVQSGLMSNRSTRQRIVQPVAEFQCESDLCSIANHFLHNIATSFVSMPASPVFDDLWNTVKTAAPYWKKDWINEQITAVGWSMMSINLALVSLGVGAVWRRRKALTLLPILFFAAYLFTNSIGLTSGGRYIAPVDWTVYLFFLAGGLQVVGWLLNLAGITKEQGDPPSNESDAMPFDMRTFTKVLPVMGFVLLLGAVLPLSEMFHQPRYQVREPDVLLTELERSGLLEQSSFSRDELLSFLAQPGAMIREGRALYPRYYPAGDGEQDRSTYYRFLDYQRLVFTLISPYSHGVEGVVIPASAPSIPFHAEDVIVLGCWNTTYYSPFIDAVVVIATSGEGYVYSRDPGAPLQCPLSTP